MRRRDNTPVYNSKKFGIKVLLFHYPSRAAAHTIALGNYPIITACLLNTTTRQDAPRSRHIPIRRSKPCCCCCYVASVVSDSVRPHRRQPTRLLCPWDSPGKNTGVASCFDHLGIKTVSFSGMSKLSSLVTCLKTTLIKV